MIRSSLRMAPDADRLTVPVPRKPRMSKCAICREPFVKRSMMHKACKPECAAIVAQRKREKEERKQLAAKREALKPRSKWMAEAQAAFNAWIRWRDRDQPCISCGRFHQGAYDAGHYRSVGSMPALRFDEDNCHKQCVPCNQHKSGNAVEYRIGLTTRIGEARVARLEGPHKAIKHTIEELKAVKATYRGRLKAAQKEAPQC